MDLTRRQRTVLMTLRMGQKMTATQIGMRCDVMWRLEERGLAARSMAPTPQGERWHILPAGRKALDELESAPETIWPYGVPGGYHDIRCPCTRHCGNCYDDLATSRAVQAKMIADGRMKPGDKLGERERYCSGYCRNQAKRERRIDRFLAAQDRSAR